MISVNDWPLINIPSDAMEPGVGHFETVLKLLRLAAPPRRIRFMRSEGTKPFIVTFAFHTQTHPLGTIVLSSSPLHSSRILIHFLLSSSCSLSIIRNQCFVIRVVGYTHIKTDRRRCIADVRRLRYQQTHSMNIFTNTRLHSNTPSCLTQTFLHILTYSCNTLTVIHTSS